MVKYVCMQVPEHSVLVGWSLGGLVAVRLASIRKDIKAVVLMASSPCFLNKPDWDHGITLFEFEKLAKELAKDREKALRRFSGLVASGDRFPRQTMTSLNNAIIDNMPSLDALRSGLEILSKEDQRRLLPELHCPVDMILGAKDVLVKPSLRDAMQNLRPGMATVEIAAGHAPFLSCPRQTAVALTKLINNFSN